MIPEPSEDLRLVALGARFAVEQQYGEQITRLANERDQALARAAQAEQALAEMQTIDQPTQPAPPPMHDHMPDVACHEGCPLWGTAHGHNHPDLEMCSAQCPASPFVEGLPDAQCPDCMRLGYSDGRVAVGHADGCSQPPLVAYAGEDR